MSTVKPGQIVQHPEHGNGVVVWDLVRDRHLVSHGAVGRLDDDLTGWGPAEVLCPGHVQVRVDDLDLRPDAPDLAGYFTAANRAAHAWKLAGYAKKSAQPDEPTSFGARIQITDHKAETAELWCRQHDGYWASEDGELATWAGLRTRGEITIGWDD